MQIVPFLFFKPGIAFLDDNDLFIQSIKSYFENKYSVFYSTDCNKMKKLIYKKNITTFVKDQLNPVENDKEEESILSLNLLYACQKIRDRVFDNLPIGVLFVDYDMPSEDGVSVSKDLKDYVRVCMLTGEMKEDKAISIFNKGDLNGYLKKNDPYLLKKIQEQIEIQISYFISDLNNIFSLFLSKNSSIKHLFKNQSFISIYKDIFSRENIIFSCIYDPYGSLVLNSKNKEYVLNVYSQEEIDCLINPYLEDITVDFKEDIISQKRILDYKRLNQTQIPDISEWRHYITANFIKIKGDQSFYLVLKEV